MVTLRSAIFCLIAKQLSSAISYLISVLLPYVGFAFSSASNFHSTLTLDYGSDRMAETSIWDYHSTLRQIPDDLRSHAHCGGSLKSRETKCLNALSPPHNWQFPVSSDEKAWYLSTLSVVKINRAGERWINECESLIEWYWQWKI
jgi:hypothetical protein